MKILAVSPVNPYPPSDGDSVRIYNFLRGLKKRGHDIFLVFLNGENEKVDAKELGSLCSGYLAVPYKKSETVVRAFLSVFNTELPINAAAFCLDKFKSAAADAAERFRPDVIFAYRLRGAACVRGFNYPVVCDAVDSLALNASRKIKYEKNLLRYAYLLLDKERLKKFESGLCREFDSVIFNFEEDADFNGSGTVIPNGAFIYKGMKKKDFENDKGRFTLGFFGHLSYHPNKDGLEWFFKYIWKKVRESDKNIFLKVFGKTGNLRLPEGVISAGFVPENDFDREISALSCVIVPVRYGTGRQNKIMRAWACSVPVVGTPYSARGVYGKDGFNMLIGHKPEDFLSSILRIKNEKGLAEKIIAGGIKTLKNKFNWNKSVLLLEEEIKKVMRRKK